MIPDLNPQGATWLAGAEGVVDLRDKVVIASLPCLDCGYELRGAPATGNCAECGASITEALSHAIDPLAHRLPSLADPRGVGNGLVAAVGAMTAAVVLPFVGFLISASALIELAGLLELAVLGAAVLVLSLGGVACWALRPREGGPLQHDARRVVTWLGVALAVLAAGQLLLWAALNGLNQPVLRAWMGLLIVGVECILVGLLLSMLALRRVLVEAGRRSRLFRTATLSKQRIGPVLIANVLSMTLFAGYWTAGQADLADASFVLGALWLVMTGMLIVGLVYMLVNAWWIRRDLRQPPPKLSKLIH